MWPFKAQAVDTKLSERVERLERDFRELKLDWEMMYDKCRKLMQRIAKRAEVVENAEHANNGGSAEEVPPDTLSPTWSKLSPRQKQIQMQVLARRQQVR